MSALPGAGFADPVHDSQESFRIALDAMARPGCIHALGCAIPGLNLGPAMSHLLLTLTDEDTPVWWQFPEAGLKQWLRFHTSARAVAQANEASFAVVTRAADLPELQRFGNGTPSAPEQGCTLLVEVPALQGGLAMQAHGPGIRHSVTLSVAGLPEGFWAEWQASHARFPQGVDIFFTCGDELLALPRTTRIGRLAEV